MDEKRKSAYRKVLYNFLIQIKEPEISDETKAARISMYASPIAYMLHNFALDCAKDFVGFDEAAFWRMIAGWDARYPELGISGFQQMFEWDLAAG